MIDMEWGRSKFPTKKRHKMYPVPEYLLELFKRPALRIGGGIQYGYLEGMHIGFGRLHRQHKGVCASHSSHTVLPEYTSNLLQHSLVRCQYKQSEKLIPA